MSSFAPLAVPHFLFLLLIALPSLDALQCMAAVLPSERNSMEVNRILLRLPIPRTKNCEPEEDYCGEGKCMFSPADGEGANIFMHVQYCTNETLCEKGGEQDIISKEDNTVTGRLTCDKWTRCEWNLCNGTRAAVGCHLRSLCWAFVAMIIAFWAASFDLRY